MYFFGPIFLLRQKLVSAAGMTAAARGRNGRQCIVFPPLVKTPDILVFSQLFHTQLLTVSPLRIYTHLVESVLCSLRMRPAGSDRASWYFVAALFRFGDEQREKQPGGCCFPADLNRGNMVFYGLSCRFLWASQPVLAYRHGSYTQREEMIPLGFPTLRTYLSPVWTHHPTGHKGSIYHH